MLDRSLSSRLPKTFQLGAAQDEALSAGVAALPDTATICTCENVSKGAVALAVQGERRT